MTPEKYRTFIKDNIEEITKKIIELDDLNDTDIFMLKQQIARGISMRKEMTVSPLDEIRQLMAGYAAIKIIEEEPDFIL